MQIFLQYSEDIIFLGSSESGLFCLKYNDEKRNYEVTLLSSLLEDNSIRFIHKDYTGNLWIGTGAGVYFSSVDNIVPNKFSFSRKLNGSFYSVCETGDEIWFGSVKSEIIAFNKKSGSQRRFSHGEGHPGKRYKALLYRNQDDTGGY